MAIRHHFGRRLTIRQQTILDVANGAMKTIPGHCMRIVAGLACVLACYNSCCPAVSAVLEGHRRRRGLYSGIEGCLALPMHVPSLPLHRLMTCPIAKLSSSPPSRVRLWFEWTCPREAHFLEGTAKYCAR